MKVAKLNREMIKAAALRLVDEREGSSNITIRDISKVLGCSHPNIYNYYASMSELWWECLLITLKEMMDSIISRLPADGSSDDRLVALFTEMTDYFLEYRGRYRLIWFDPAPSAPTDEINAQLAIPGAWLVQYFMQLYPQVSDPKIAEAIMQFLHRYYHGEISTIISGRVPTSHASILRQRIRQNIALILRTTLANTGDIYIG